MAKNTVVDSEFLKAGKIKFSAFLENNPSSQLVEVQGDGVSSLGILNPWGDRSLAILVPEESGALEKLTKEIFLPPRYTAIYHRQAKKLEVIWTAFKLDGPLEDISNRKFSFRLRGKTHDCEFSKSSDHLMELAKNYVQLGITTTEFRNLRSFRGLLEDGDENDPFNPYSSPVSFWISNVTWNDNRVLELIRHLNFYLRYYDAQSPLIEIHPEKPDEIINPKSRYIEDGFPSKIVSKELDPTLLVFYRAAIGQNNASNFLNFYRIIEFVSYSFMHTDLQKKIKGVLDRPSALDDSERSANEILMMLREAKLEREKDAITRLLKEVIEPSVLWKEVCENKDFFCKPVKFDGSMEVTALISKNDELENFRTHGIENFSNVINVIRNALAHGKESKSSKSILPTSRNFDLLKPYIHLISVAAGEVVLYDANH